MRINAKKTKVITIGKDIPEHELNIVVNGNILERVDSFVYLGKLLTTNERNMK